MKKTLSRADATAVNPPKRTRRVRATNPPPLRVIKGRGWVA
jgi:hypothetical protein